MVSYRELKLGVVFELSNRSSWSSATEKVIDSFTVQVIFKLSLFDYLLSYYLLVSKRIKQKLELSKSMAFTVNVIKGK